MKWAKLHKELEKAIAQAKADSSNIDMLHEDEKRVSQLLERASNHHAAAEEQPGREAEDIQAGFHLVGKAREILGSNSVQSNSFRRHQFPFLPPEKD